MDVANANRPKRSSAPPKPERRRRSASRERGQGREADLRAILAVLERVKRGDFSARVDVRASGGTVRLIAQQVNEVVDQLESVGSEIIRGSREVGTDGKLGAHAEVGGKTGTWRDLTDNINNLAGNLTNQVRNIALVTTAVANGDLSKQITVEAKGEVLELKNTINTMVEQLRSFASEVTRVAREVGTDGKLGGQAQVPGVAGTWKDLTDNVNQLAENLTNQVRNIALVTKAVASGDLSQQITVEVRGEILDLKNTINTMVEQLRAFAAEVTRVAREVGTDGKLGGQATVPGVSGTWKDLTENVNVMASNLTSQVRGIAKVVLAVANGDLQQKLALVAKGEIASLAETINNMTDTLRVFAEQVTNVAREVGIEGKLGGQAKVPGASGTWRALTDAVNQLAGNLTTQVRAIAEVATAVTAGDLTRAISVQAKGEVLQLKDNINQMIANLRDTTRANKEQDWLKSNLARFSSMMQGQRKIEALGRLIMSELTPVVSAQFAAFYVLEGEDDAGTLKLISSYAYESRKRLANRFELGEGLAGQCALERKCIVVGDVPDGYVNVSSGLGSAAPRNLVVVPVLFEGRLMAVIELASFQTFTAIHLNFLDQLAQSIGVVFNMIAASMRTEELLLELQRSNTELASRSKELEEQASELEIKNRAIAQASASLEEKARELSRTSRYKSEFLANMSHELRTPLNSLLILARLLADNRDGALSPKQVQYASTICTSGQDLLSLINEILDLSKIEAGKIELRLELVAVAELVAFMRENFEQQAKERDLELTVEVDRRVPELLTTDPQRLKQVLKNLLSNAFKFTHAGRITVAITLAHGMEVASGAQGGAPLVAFAVSDTGIGIPLDKQRQVFEAFQQADASTSRTYGGTGLGLTISRELARLLGGEIGLESSPGVGSTFTLYLPLGDDAALVTPPPRKLSLESRTSDEARLEGATVLVVDDDPRNTFAVTSLLEAWGVTVLTADCATRGIAMLEEHPGIGVVLMDIMMPEVDGFAATRRIRMRPRYRDLPIIALTSKVMKGDRERCLAAGCSDFVAKPIDPSRLHGVLQRWIAERDGARLLPTPSDA